jgi:hypothetical protein
VLPLNGLKYFKNNFGCNVVNILPSIGNQANSESSTTESG